MLISWGAMTTPHNAYWVRNGGGDEFKLYVVVVETALGFEYVWRHEEPIGG